MTEFVGVLRSTAKVLAVAGALSMVASCTGSGEAGTGKHTATSSAPATEALSQETTPDSSEVECSPIEAIFTVSTEELEGKKPAPIAMGFRYLHEITTKEGVFGTEVLSNPSVTKCDLKDGSSRRTLTTMVVLGDKPTDTPSPTGVATIEFYPDGKTYGLRGETGKAAIQTDKGSMAWGPDGYLDPAYDGDDTLLTISEPKSSREDCAYFDSCSLVVAKETGAIVMQRIFYPNKTLDQVVHDGSSQTA